jgi:hypothetical protein
MILRPQFLIFTAVFSLLNLATIAGLQAQDSPQKINYQAVARDASGEVLSDVSMEVEFNIYEGSATGPTVYSEIHSDVLTDSFGLFTVKIGDGVVVSGDFSSIDWSNGTWLNVGIDIGNGTEYLGSYELVSVPYALYANRSDTATYGEDADADPSNELQDLSIGLTLNESVEIGLTGTDPVSFSIEDADADSTNEIQSLILDGATLSLSGDTGNEVDLASFNTDDQALSIDSTDPQAIEISLENSDPVSFSINDADSDASNEIQELNLDGNVLTLSGDASGTAVDLASYNTDDQGLSINDANPQNVIISLENSSPVNFSIEDADANSSNELISNFSFNSSNNDLSITEAGATMSVDLSELKTDQNWEANGQNISNLNTGNVGINESNPSSTLQIMGSTAVKVRVEGPSGTSYQLGEETVFVGKPDVGDVEVDLPFAADVPGRVYIIKKGDTSTLNDLKVHASGSDKIEGQSTYILGNVSGVYEQIMIVSDGVSDWWIISKE